MPEKSANKNVKSMKIKLMSMTRCQSYVKDVAVGIEAMSYCFVMVMNLFPNAAACLVIDKVDVIIFRLRSWISYGLPCAFVKQSTTRTVVLPYLREFGSHQ